MKWSPSPFATHRREMGMPRSRGLSRALFVPDHAPSAARTAIQASSARTRIRRARGNDRRGPILAAGHDGGDRAALGRIGTRGCSARRSRSIRWSTPSRRHEPALFWLSVSFIPDEAEFISGFNRLFEAASKTNTAIVVGGRALDVRDSDASSATRPSATRCGTWKSSPKPCAAKRRPSQETPQTTKERLRHR